MPLFSRNKQDDDTGRRDGEDFSRGPGVKDSSDDPNAGRMAPDDPRKPGSPTELSKRSWFGVAKRAFTEFKADNVTDWAAALTYYAVLSIFPALTVFVALLGLLGQGTETVDKLLGILEDIGVPEGVRTTLQPAIENVVAQQGGAGALVGLGLLGSLWTASGYVGAFIRASNAIYEVEEGRKFYILRPLQIVVTIAGVLLLTAITLALISSGSVAQAIGSAIGLSDTVVTVWNIAKWPIIIIIVSLMIGALYNIAPNVKQPKFKWFTLGGFLALVLWVIASAAFGFYVGNFGSYNKTYGTLGAVIGFLVWMWITNNVLLFGAEVNAELERGRQIEAGQPDAEDEIKLPYRKAPKD
ncbi:MAG TPA: YihY/virulence factor BrkB family protein [Mycobacteriales bacterium]|jgi:membrane protein|nr:YihY/virulence factor BrkB family protein [Mycobacteriales bacterium]